MKYLRTYIFNTVLTLAMLLMLTIPAFAVSVPFYDVTSNTPLYECTTYLSERGITNGTGNGRFSPEAPITTSQWAIMLCRAYGVETNGNSWSELSRSAVEQSYRRGWLSETAIFTLNTQLCRGTLYKSAFAAAGIPVYDSVLYEDRVALPDYENCIRIGKELQLCGEGDDANEIVTRGETAKLLHAILTKTFTVEAPATPVTLVNAAGVNVNDFLLELRKVPKPILDAFNAAGWTYRIDFDYIGELSGQLNISCIEPPITAGKPSTSHRPARRSMSSDISWTGKWASPQSMSGCIWQKRRTPDCGIMPKPTPENTLQTALPTTLPTKAIRKCWNA